MATTGTKGLWASAELTAEASNPAARPNIEIRPPRTKPPATQRWYRCVTRSVSRGTSTGLRTWRVDTQRFRTLKNCTVFRLETMSPTPTARPATATTRNNTIKNWTSKCHIKLA